jgi:hypothetical protein
LLAALVVIRALETTSLPSCDPVTHHPITPAPPYTRTPSHGENVIP